MVGIEMTLKGHFNPINFEVDENGCFNCISHKPGSRNGYRVIINHNKRIYLHRFVYEQMFGEIPDGLLIRHKCDNPACINPEHLETGTHADNMRDMVERGRHVSLYGSKNPRAKLTENDVKKIKKLIPTCSERNLAKQFGVSRTCIRLIKSGKKWKHVD